MRQGVDALEVALCQRSCAAARSSTNMLDSAARSRSTAAAWRCDASSCWPGLVATPTPASRAGLCDSVQDRAMPGVATTRSQSFFPSSGFPRPRPNPEAIVRQKRSRLRPSAICTKGYPIARNRTHPAAGSTWGTERWRTSDRRHERHIESAVPIWGHYFACIEARPVLRETISRRQRNRTNQLRRYLPVVEGSKALSLAPP